MVVVSEVSVKTDQLKEGIRLANLFLDEYDDSDRDLQYWGVFRVLVEHTEKFLEEDVPLDRLKLDGQELYKKCLSAFEMKDGQDPFRFCNKHYKTLQKKLKQLNELLIKLAGDNHISTMFYVGKRKSVGGKGNRSYYFLGVKEIDEHSLNVEKNRHVEEKDIEFVTYMPHKTKLPFYSAWLTNMTITGGWRYFFVLVVLSPVISLAILGFLPLLNMFSETIATNNVVIIVYSLIYSVLGAAVMWPIYRVLQYRVIRAPDIIAPSNFENILLELRSLAEHEGRGKRFVISTYKATCPKCGHPISLSGGKLSYFGRIVGRCTESPREHIYSFDHVTRRGQRLR
jgi:hypothetical protein